MKKLLHYTLFIFSLTSFSQVTYLSTDYASQTESFLVSHSTTGLVGNDFVQTGANLVWDYSNLAPSTQETIQFQNPNTAGYKNIWCFLNGFLFNCNTQFNNNFNLATKLSNGIVIQGNGLTNIIDHLKLSSTALENKMIGAAITLNGATVPFAASYQIPDKLYQFPITYSSNYSNASTLNLDLTNLNVPLQYASNGIRTNVVEGWGALTTPFGVFANVLKLKTTLVNNITVTLNGTPTQNTITTISYQWFDKAYGIPVLQVDGNEVGGQFVATNISYFDIPRCLSPNALFAFFPLTSDINPVTGNASVSFINLSNNYDSLVWNFGDGTPTSTAVNPTHNFSCPGISQVTLTATNAFCNPAQVNSITLPVTITDTQNFYTTGVTLAGTTLTADRTLTGTTYQWVACNVNNEQFPLGNSQSFTPTVSGSYAVFMTTNGCESISDCTEVNLLANSSFEFENKITLVPNPTNGSLAIINPLQILVKEIAIYDALGNLVSIKLDMSAQSAGIYFVKITTEKGVIVKKVIKK